MVILVLLLVTSVYSISQEKFATAIGPCILNKCPRGHYCEDNNCLPDMNKMEKIGPCVNTLCPNTYRCNNEMCIRPIPKIKDGSLPIGPCINEKCPENYVCKKEETKCYPMEE